MTNENLFFFQQVMLFTDGALVVMSYWLAFYWSKGEDNSAIIKGLFVFFITKTVVSILFSISDTFVIQKVSTWYATLPIIRGLVGRFPEACAEAYLLYAIYRKAEKRDDEGRV